MTEFAAPLPILSRYGIMVDVGYVYAAAGELLFGTSSRRDFRVDADPLIQAVIKHADGLVRGELLRVYWYDAARDRVPTIDQRVIAQMPRVKLRLGNLNARGQQKGVDAQIRSDMEALARNRAVTDTVLVAGDEDMVPAIEAAQAYGVRVHLWGVEPPYGTNQAERLLWESDTVDILDAAFLRSYFTRQLTAAVEPVPPADSQAASAAAGPGADVPSPAQLFGERLSARAGHLDKTGQIGRTGDGVERTIAVPPAGGGEIGTISPAPGGHGGPAGLGGGAEVSDPPPSSVPAATLPAPAGPLVAGAQAGRLGPDRQRVVETGEHVAQKWILTRGRDNIRDLLPGPILPPVIDKELLVESEKELGLSLRPYQEAREWLRDAFWARVHREFGVVLGRQGD